MDPRFPKRKSSFTGGSDDQWVRPERPEQSVPEVFEKGQTQRIRRRATAENVLMPMQVGDDFAFKDFTTAQECSNNANEMIMGPTTNEPNFHIAKNHESSPSDYVDSAYASLDISPYCSHELPINHSFLPRGPQLDMVDDWGGQHISSDRSAAESWQEPFEDQTNASDPPCVQESFRRYPLPETDNQILTSQSEADLAKAHYIQLDAASQVVEKGLGSDVTLTHAGDLQHDAPNNALFSPVPVFSQLGASPCGLEDEPYSFHKITEKSSQSSDTQQECSISPQCSGLAELSEDQDSCLSNESEEQLSRSPQSCKELTISFAKHRVMVSVMRYFYSLFDDRWESQCRQVTSSHDEQGRHQVNVQKATIESSYPKRSEQLGDQSDSENDNHQKKRRKRRRANSMTDLGRKTPLFACPFHKYDSQRYRTNESRGHRYRTCAGPGFISISRLKTHLERVHRVVQCQRCWTVMDNTQELTEHLNEETRCQKQMPEPEGIDQTKMSLIKSKHGVSWESIYEILFPGARIPSPYWQPETDSEQAEDPSSPQSRQLQEFEAYSRRVLPQLVEAHLSASLDNDLAPLEETLKARVGDLVRSCQSMVYEKFQKFQQTSKETQEAQSRPSASDSQPNFKPNDTLTRNITPPEQSNKLFFDEPTHLQPAIDFSDVVNKDDGMKYNATQSRTADSGYGSASQSCLCSCHSSIENAMPAEREVMAGAEASGQLKPQCTTCAFYHTESTLDQNLQSGYDWNAIDFDLYHTEQNDENNATFWS